MTNINKRCRPVYRPGERGPEVIKGGPKGGVIIRANAIIAEFDILIAKGATKG